MSDDLRLRVDPELKALFDGLGETDYEGLKEDIKKRGFLVPLIVAQDGTIVSGHRRFQIAQELGIEAPRIVREFKNKEEMIEVAITDNLLRRQLSNYELGLLGLRVLPYEEEKARERQLSFGQICPDEETGRARDIVAKMVGISGRTLHDVKYIEECGTEEEKAEGRRRGKVNPVYVKIKRREKIEQLGAEAKILIPPDGEYDVIVIDPPWPYDERGYDPEGFWGTIPYPPMSIEELKELELPAKDDCILWLWTTNAFIHDAFHLIERWDFSPKTILTWVKDRMGCGTWLRGRTEHCILAVKGKPTINLTNQTTVIYGVRREHSRKPNEFYELVDSLCFGSKLDYFGREKREGWAVYGTLELEEAVT